MRNTYTWILYRYLEGERISCMKSTTTSYSFVCSLFWHLIILDVSINIRNSPSVANFRSKKNVGTLFNKFFSQFKSLSSSLPVRLSRMSLFLSPSVYLIFVLIVHYPCSLINFLYFLVSRSINTGIDVASLDKFSVYYKVSKPIVFSLYLVLSLNFLVSLMYTCTPTGSCDSSWQARDVCGRPAAEHVIIAYRIGS